MELNCEKCSAIMERTRGREHTKYVCPECGHVVKREAGKKKFYGIRLYDHQKHAADKRGGVQMVVDTVLDEDDE